MRRLLLGLMLVVFVGLLACGPALAAPVRLTPNEKQVLVLVNRERTKRGLAALHVQCNLMRAARSHSRAMACLPFFSHVSPSGATLSSRARRFGYICSGIRSLNLAENIAWGAGLFSTPAQIVASWMKSPGHRRNILTASFRDIGIGIGEATLMPDGRQAECVRYFTIDLGRRSR